MEEGALQTKLENDDRNEEEDELLSDHSDHTSNTSFYGDSGVPNRNVSR